MQLYKKNIICILIPKFRNKQINKYILIYDDVSVAWVTIQNF